jgi:hypothetical protein
MGHPGLHADLGLRGARGQPCPQGVSRVTVGFEAGVPYSLLDYAVYTVAIEGALLEVAVAVQVQKTGSSPRLPEKVIHLSRAVTGQVSWWLP